MLADVGRAREADLADHAAGDQRLADQPAVAMDQLGDALGDAGIGERSEQLGSDPRSFVRRAQMTVQPAASAADTFFASK